MTTKRTLMMCPDCSEVFPPDSGRVHECLGTSRRRCSELEKRVSALETEVSTLLAVIACEGGK